MIGKHLIEAFPGALDPIALHEDHRARARKEPSASLMPVRAHFLPAPTEKHTGRDCNRCHASILADRADSWKLSVPTSAHEANGPLVARESLDRMSGRRIAVPLRVIAAWLTVVAMLVQLTATAACAAGHASAPPRLFPICHASSFAKDAVEEKRAPEHQPTRWPDSCPFCSTCCHAAVALPPATAFLVPAPVATRIEEGRLRPRPVSGSRVCPAASPRGPPIRA